MSCVPLVTPACGAQVIRGIVVEVETLAPVTGATVEVLGEGNTEPRLATTDSLGLFVISLSRAGTYTIQAKRLGFLVAPPDTLRIGRGEAVSLELRLGSRAVPLEPVVVTVRGDEGLNGFERRRAGAFGRFIGREEIDARAAMKTTDLLRLMPGLVFEAQRAGSGSQLLMRGPGGLCAPAVWIDGLYVSLTGRGVSVDDLLSPGVLEGVEVYNSVAAAPTQYRTGQCGVVLFWTRRGAPEPEGTMSWRKIAVGAVAAALFIVLVIR
jgi:hypothetical protein